MTDEDFNSKAPCLLTLVCGLNSKRSGVGTEEGRGWESGSFFPLGPKGLTVGLVVTEDSLGSRPIPGTLFILKCNLS